jgi:predicted phosphodiesterase
MVLASFAVMLLGQAVFHNPLGGAAQFASGCSVPTLLPISTPASSARNVPVRWLSFSAKPWYNKQALCRIVHEGGRIMRIAVFSDIHGNIVGLNAVFADLRRHEPIDYYFALGDFLAIGPGTDDLLALLRKYNTRMVRGNWDEIFTDKDTYMANTPAHLRPTVEVQYAWLLHHLSADSQRVLATLPLHDEVSITPTNRLFFCHAAPDNPWSNTCSAQTATATLEATYGAIPADLILYGHYHAHHVLALGQKLLINVASVGMNPSQRSAYTIIDCTDNRYCIHQYQVPYDLDAFARLSRERHVPGAW